jgi:hypothetical protein
MSDYIITNGELYHHGVKGMKWGVRRYQNKDGSLTEAGQKRQVMRDAKQAKYNAKIDKYHANATYNRAIQDVQKVTLNKTRRIAYDHALGKAAADYKSASKAYKDSKKDYRQAKKDFKEQKNIDKFKKHGLDYNKNTIANAYAHGYKGAKRIEDRIANEKMSRLKSEMIETGRSSARAAALTIGTVSVLALAGAASNPKTQVLDATGKVIKNIYR